MAENKPDDSLNDALGIGETFEFSNGAQLPCVPCSLAELEPAMKYYGESLMRFNLQGCYMSGNEKAKKSLHELLKVATGLGDEELKEKLKEIPTANGGQEVIQYITRFLGFVTPNPAKEEKPE